MWDKESSGQTFSSYPGVNLVRTQDISAQRASLETYPAALNVYDKQQGCLAA